MQNERNEAFKNEKLAEERVKILQEDHTKALAKLKNKYELKVGELDEQLRNLTSNMSDAESKHKSREDDELKKNTEFTKLNALIEQKLELTEKELS